MCLHDVKLGAVSEAAVRWLNGDSECTCYDLFLVT